MSLKKGELPLQASPGLSRGRQTGQWKPDRELATDLLLSIQNLTRTMVLREDQAKATYTQKVDFAKLRSELLSADSTESATTRASHERLTNDLAKLNARLRDEVGRTQASVRLDLNLEKGRIREEANVQELKIKETETKIEQEVAGLREKLEAVKFQTLQWLMGVCTGKNEELQNEAIANRFNRYCCFDTRCLEIIDVENRRIKPLQSQTDENNAQLSRASAQMSNSFYYCDLAECLRRAVLLCRTHL